MQEVDRRTSHEGPGAVDTSQPSQPSQLGAQGHDASQPQSAEMLKWREMMDFGIGKYMREEPEKFHRRVRRGIPAEFRWEVWKAAVQYQKYQEEQLVLSYDALSNEESKDWSQLIRVDIGRTFPERPEFDKDQQECLYRVLNAYANHNPSVGYCQGMNFVAGLLLIISGDERETFGVFVCLMDYDGLSGFYKERLPLLRIYLRACDRLVAETVPELRDHFIRENVQPAVYLHQWFLTLFINCFPLSMVTIIWDVIICDGLPVILSIAVSILQVLKDSLLAMKFEDIIKFFKMMKTYDDEDGEFNAFRIGQLLMKHTEHVELPEHILEYLQSKPEDIEQNGSEEWEREQGTGRWFRQFSKSLSWLAPPTQRRRPHRMVASGPVNEGVPDEDPLQKEGQERKNQSNPAAPNVVRHDPNAPQGEAYTDVDVAGWEFL